MKFFSKNKTNSKQSQISQQTLLIKSSIGSHHQEEQTQYNHQHRHNIFQWLVSALLDCENLKIPIFSRSNRLAYISPGIISIKLEQPTAPIMPIITSKLPKKMARAVRIAIAQKEKRKDSQKARHSDNQSVHTSLLLDHLKEANSQWLNLKINKQMTLYKERNG